MPLIALSSGEAELCAVTRAAAEGIGVQALFADFGHEVTVELHSDASAAIGICKRLGLGRVRHLAVADLWLQQRLRQKDLMLAKTPGKTNMADVLTKFRSCTDIFRLLSPAGLYLAPGRPSCAPVRSKFTIGGRDTVPEGFLHLPTDHTPLINTPIVAPASHLAASSDATGASLTSPCGATNAPGKEASGPKQDQKEP